MSLVQNSLLPKSSDQTQQNSSNFIPSKQSFDVIRNVDANVGEGASSITSNNQNQQQQQQQQQHPPPSSYPNTSNRQSDSPPSSQSQPSLNIEKSNEKNTDGAPQSNNLIKATGIKMIDSLSKRNNNPDII
ncbi:hypothetical protein QR98_0025550 [Sarcoptes scabiei]|uniref:Uncharacterized protein n=1 Tax=Sarcoptes scabiei TaxID=52283 RepID=A0A132A0P6_SARSC|nr:hypothetical protein QR98_0025550 [Sarcoptes scabiei]